MTWLKKETPSTYPWVHLSSIHFANPFEPNHRKIRLVTDVMARGESLRPNCWDLGGEASQYDWQVKVKHETPLLKVGKIVVVIFIWATFKTLLSFHDTGCFIGILIMAYYNPHITG